MGATQNCSPCLNKVHKTRILPQLFYPCFCLKLAWTEDMERANLALASGIADVDRGPGGVCLNL